ncbi:GreA/GreB family elongation factor [Candidatus Wolfebacteria bacterium]|nr:GreA/GreB family elongation factor [Candidatus Wolfebacteria bacterium]
MDKIEIKKKIIEFAKIELKKKIDFLNKIIDDEQKESASHKGRMESRYDTFKEEAQMRRDAYKKQLFDTQNLLLIINEIPLKINKSIQIGSIIETNEKIYFISIGVLGPIKINKQDYVLISPESPIGQILLQKKCGDEFEFRGKKIKIKNIF